MLSRVESLARCGFTLRSWKRASCLRKKRFSAASARRDRETSTRRWRRSRAMDDNVVRLCVNGRKMEPGMNVQLYTLRDFGDSELAAERDFCGPTVVWDHGKAKHRSKPGRNRAPFPSSFDFLQERGDPPVVHHFDEGESPPPKEVPWGPRRNQFSRPSRHQENT